MEGPRAPRRGPVRYAYSKSRVGQQIASVKCPDMSGYAICVYVPTLVICYIRKLGLRARVRTPKSLRVRVRPPDAFTSGGILWA
jgi:hypothetical protein